MKTLITLIVISLCLFSCKKEEEIKPNLKKVEIRFKCESCSIEVKSGNYSINERVFDFFNINTLISGEYIEILVSGDSNIDTHVVYNNKSIFKKSDGFGNFNYKIKID